MTRPNMSRPRPDQSSTASNSASTPAPRPSPPPSSSAWQRRFAADPHADRLTRRASDVTCECFHKKLAVSGVPVLIPMKKDRPAVEARGKISESTVRRLSSYLRLLQEAHARGQATISSEELAERGGTTSAQVRKDLSFFGSFGKRGDWFLDPAAARSRAATAPPAAARARARSHRSGSRPTRAASARSERGLARHVSVRTLSRGIIAERREYSSARRNGWRRSVPPTGFTCWRTAPWRVDG